ncbi:MAG: hypothetical protein ACLP0J_14380 [Solirubrobacteraceae bacterium]
MIVFFKAAMVIAPAYSESPRRGDRIPALAHVANRPIAHHVLDGLVQAGVEQVIVICAADAVMGIRGSLGDYEPCFDRIAYAVCHDSVDIGVTLAASAPLVGDAPCVIQSAEGLLDAPIGPLLELLDQGAPDLVLFVAPEVDQDGNDEPSLFMDTEPRFDLEQPTAEFGVFGPGALRRASDLVGCSHAGDLAIAGQFLAGTGGRVCSRPLEGWRRYRGHGSELLQLNRIALDRLTVHMSSGGMTKSNRIEGHVTIDPTATVRDSSIVGPVVIGAGATVLDAYIGPYTTIGPGARIECVEIERSIVYPYASVTHVGGRLVSSLVGRGARVFRDFSLPRAMRLSVGEGDEVVLF